MKMATMERMYAIRLSRSRARELASPGEGPGEAESSSYVFSLKDLAFRDELLRLDREVVLMHERAFGLMTCHNRRFVYDIA